MGMFKRKERGVRGGGGGGGVKTLISIYYN